MMVIHWSMFDGHQAIDPATATWTSKDHIVVAAGSGGTLAGLALALHLAGGKQQLLPGMKFGEFPMKQIG